MFSGSEYFIKSSARSRPALSVAVRTCSQISRQLAVNSSAVEALIDGWDLHLRKMAYIEATWVLDQLGLKRASLKVTKKRSAPPVKCADRLLR